MEGGKTALAALLLCALACAACAASCDSQRCSNNNDCDGGACSMCSGGYCSQGRPCRGLCVVDTDCDQFGSCPLCREGQCSDTAPTPPSPPARSYDATKTCIMNGDNSFCGPTVFVSVEHNWKPETCAMLSSDISYKGYYDVGCTNNETVVWNDSDYPDPDCGWNSGVANDRFNMTKQCIAVISTGGCTLPIVLGAGIDWSSTQCNDLVEDLFGDVLVDWRLMCSYDYFQGGYSIGASDGGLPPSNCGWSNSTHARFGDEAAEEADEGAVKLCIGWDRDAEEMVALNVNPLWSFQECYDWGREYWGTSHIMQVGCIFRDGYSLGAKGGGVPSRNCGWKL